MAGFSFSSMAGESEVLHGVKLLSGENDSYGGVIVEIKEHMDSTVFAPTLRASVAQWRKHVCLLLKSLNFSSTIKLLVIVIFLVVVILFSFLLPYSVSSMQGKKGVWIKLPIEHVNLVETAVKVL